MSMNTNQLTKLMAIGTIATGIAAVFSATPARAATFNGGQLSFSGSTLDFYDQLINPSIGSFNINFHPLGFNFIFSNTLTVPSGVNSASSLAVPSLQTLAPNIGTFTRTSADTFTLSNQLSFVFGSGTRVNIAGGNLFQANFATAGSVNLGFAGGNGIGTIVNNTDSTPTSVLSFTINDTSFAGGGTYGVIAGIATPPKPIPEPLTVIGTIIGGAVALRMRKKLSAVSNN